MFVNGFVRNVFVNMVRERLERLVREPCLSLPRLAPVPFLSLYLLLALLFPEIPLGPWPNG